jgi:glycosyltransferase involved in cell wall biosynthesis
VAANDAEYYASKGHPNAFYIRSVWIDRFPDGAWRAHRRDKERGDTIIANVGKLPGTANTLGLEILGRDVLPRLRERVGDGAYRVRLLGAGSLRRDLEPYFQRPEVEFAGFVPDIDDAMLQAGVFLCVNNASRYKVGHTRYLHAWSLGGCVVAHRDAALSMPEIRHDENALLGNDASEIADLVARAMSDAPLRRRLGEAGYQTFVNLFTAPTVARSIIERIDAAAPSRARSTRRSVAV